MQPKYIVEPFGPPIPNVHATDLCELSVGHAGLWAVVSLGEDERGNETFAEIPFTAPRGFRYLDEGDLLPYWSSGDFDTAHHLLFEIKRGGWAEQEEHGGFLNVTLAVGNYLEWFIASSNACLNVLSAAEPIVRLI